MSAGSRIRINVRLTSAVSGKLFSLAVEVILGPVERGWWQSNDEGNEHGSTLCPL
jgi:hypothetical protein